jgi:MSHA biogenesis protein MshP
MSAMFLERQRGFSIATAIFLVVILSALGAAILLVSTMQHTSSAMDIKETRAYQAARAGVE